MNINSNKIVLICYLWLLMLVVADAGSGLKAQDVQHTVDVVNDYFSVERALTTENGLPANGVNGVIQDSKGYIWATTFGGLIRYDGKRIVTYNTSNLPGLESNRFLDISEDKGGT